MSSLLEQRLQAQRNRKKRRPFLLVLLGLLIISISATCTYWFFTADPQNTPTPIAKLLGPGRKVNVLVLGVDKRQDDVGRSDTMFVITLDTETKDVTMVSVPRDTRVKIPGRGWDKINHAFAFGGVDLSQKAVEGLLGIKIDYQVQIDMNSFKKIVDAVGGVTIDVEKRMYYSDPWDDNGGLVINLRPGEQHMDGETAIQYVRYRDEEGDIGRVARQQKFIKALLDEVTSPAILPKIPMIIKEVAGAIKTDMSIGDMVSYGKMLNDARKKGLQAYMVPGRGAYIGDISYWLPNIMEMRQYVAKVQGYKVEERYLDGVRRLESEYEASIPREMKVADPPKAAAKPTEANSKTGDKAGKDKSGTASTGSAQSQGKTVDKIHISVVNCTGTQDGGEKMAALLRSRGFDVVGVSVGQSPAEHTTVTAYSSSASGKLGGLPFKYGMQVSPDESRADRVTIIAGKDFVGK